MTKSRLIALAGSVFVLSTVGGCTSMRLVDNTQTKVDERKATVALSIDTTGLAKAPGIPGEWDLGGSRVGFRESQLIQVGSDKASVGAAIVETNAERIQLDDLLLAWFVEDGVYLFGTAGEGPEIETPAGAFVYLGNLKIENIQFDDSGNPATVSACFEDNWEQDATLWGISYPMTAELAPVKNIGPCWGENGAATLEQIRVGKDGYSENAGIRYFRPLPPPTDRSSAPNSNQSRTR